ncbi:MAG: hypothetical protein K2Q32_07485 [Alphaproteobacteria bacterium]|nr:hypothetical protein [Alphaproteobacteria bacterium]
MTPRSNEPSAIPDTRSNDADDATDLTQLLRRARRACLTSKHFTLCLRTAILRHSGRGPPHSSE